MVLTAVEWIAAIFAILGIVKLVVIAVNKKSWYDKVVKPVYGNVKVAGYVFLVLAVIVFYFLIQTFTIVEIFAVMAFTSLFIGVAFISFGNELGSFIKKAYTKKFSTWIWIYSIIWLILSLWVLYQIFWL